MSSSPDEAVGPETRERVADAFIVWNRRLHYYLGLYLLFFCWLFVFTGLLLNHSRWHFAQFWANRAQSTIEHQFEIPEAATDMERARDLMRQFGIVGEIQWPAPRPTGAPLAFQVTRPGLVIDVTADLGSRRATLQRNELNGWGVMQVLHTFTGVRPADARNARDWTVTTVWALSMDAVAAGLIIMVLSSYLMWYRLKAKRREGLVALLLGGVSCGALLTGLRVAR